MGGYETNINFEKDITLFPWFYPLHILTTNRMIDSPISRINEKRTFRVPVFNGMQDLASIIKMMGVRSMYMGFGASTLNYFANSTRYFGNNNDEEYDHPIGFYSVLVGMIAMNPLQMLITRM